MIRIERLSDINLLRATEPLLRDYIMHSIGFYCQQYDCTEIAGFGAFYILETKDDIDNHNALGLPCPIEDTVFEFVDLITIRQGAEENTFVSALALLDSDYGVNIFINPKLLTDIQRENLYSECTRKGIEINVSKRTISN